MWEDFMKIAAYEVRDDEMKAFSLMQQVHDLDMIYINEELNLSTIKLASGCDGITVLGHSFLSKEILDQVKAEGISFISTRTIGYNHIDVVHARKIGLRVSKSDYDPNGVADYAVMLILLTLRNYKQALYRANCNDYSLGGLRGKEMRNLTVGVVGTGRIGQCVIRNLQGFGCKIYAYDLHPEEQLKGMAEYVSLDEIYEKCNCITYHIPLFESTYHMVNKESIQKMQDDVIVINTARGELMDVESLIEGIETKKIGALGLDVIEQEEGIYHQDLRSHIVNNRAMAYLRQFPNVVMTQHIAFYTKEAVDSMVRYGIQNLLDFKQKGQCRLEII